MSGGGVVILDDWDLEMPLRQQIKPIFDAGIRVRWIRGHHHQSDVLYGGTRVRGLAKGEAFRIRREDLA
jgi:hypothetical protein